MFGNYGIIVGSQCVGYILDDVGGGTGARYKIGKMGRVGGGLFHGSFALYYNSGIPAQRASHPP